jgi:hypothetical protein
MSDLYEHKPETRNDEKSAFDLAAAAASAACSREASQSSVCARPSVKSETGDYLVFSPVNEHGETWQSTARASSLTEKRKDLDKQIDSLAGLRLLNSSQATQMRADMTAFEKRAKEQGLTSETVARTYNQVSRLLETSNEQPLPAHKLRAALDIMAIAADPSSNNQGAHNTCNVTALENRLFTRQPDLAAGLVADVAATGKYKATDGTTVTLDKESLTIQPEELEAANRPRGENYRNYASQLFQVTAINLLYERENRQTGGRKHYVQGCDDDHTGKGQCPPVKVGSELVPNPTGEKVVSYAKDGKPETVSVDMMEQKGGSLQDLVDINTMITGKYEPEAFLQRKETVKPGEKRGNLIADREDFEVQLAKLKARGQLPAVVAVNVANEPFYSLALSKRPPGQTAGLDTSTLGHDGHWVLITDYDARTHELRYKNQAGSEQNPEEPVSVSKFYEAMTDARATVWLDRLEKARAGGKLSDNDYAAGLAEIMCEYEKRWSSRGMNTVAPAKTDAENQQQARYMYEKALSRLNPRLSAMVHEEVSRASQTTFSERLWQLLQLSVGPGGPLPGSSK